MAVITFLSHPSAGKPDIPGFSGNQAQLDTKNSLPSDAPTYHPFQVKDVGDTWREA
jgi:hypothetical protein